MQDNEERRAPGVKRVPVERVVEICGRDETIPAFEAESVELSGRGMHVRTPYLPELNSPLVCRLEDQGREIVVEGQVAWRDEHDGGGEFGIKFTALDSGSVETLKHLIGFGRPSTPAPAPVQAAKAEATEAASDPTPEPGPVVEDPKHVNPGAPVKLHIEGLGSPMKARVRRGNERRVHVGSNLEFLKVGRTLEIEDVEDKERTGAQIDSVKIAIDPQTQVPQLVVALRYEGVEDTTPEPSVVDGEEDDLSEVGHAPAAPRQQASPASIDDDEDFDDEEIEALDQANAMRERFEGVARGAGQAAKTTGVFVARASKDAAGVAGRLASGVRSRFIQWRDKRDSARPAAARRRTAPPPSGGVSSARRLRPQSMRPQAEDGSKRRKVKMAAIGGGGLVLALAAGGFALSGGSDEAAEVTAEVVEMDMDEIQAPAAAKVAPAEPAVAPKPQPERKKGGIVADVPLFGPTPMATMEPAPLGAPPDEEEEPSTPDESFDKPSKKSKGGPESVQPWGQGRLELPFVHRVRLDSPGDALEGTKRPTGFSVFVPGRKALDTGKAIEKRDDRIVQVRAKNSPKGTRITFVFQGKIPGYKVRLRRSYIEFFISSPAG